MGNQMVRMKRAPLSAPALRMLRQIADGGNKVTAADLFDVSKPRAWDALHALASRDLVKVESGIITVTKQGRSALRAPAPKKPATKKQTAQRPAKAEAPKRAARSTVRFK